ncbi:unnamed protein product [Amoebophrya sp. A25]|nr:unnamed protein product [Amoebophrya sp. A25]|eukprot:GSA25T00000506001.1
MRATPTTASQEEDNLFFSFKKSAQNPQKRNSVVEVASFLRLHEPAFHSLAAIFRSSEALEGTVLLQDVDEIESVCKLMDHVQIIPTETDDSRAGEYEDDNITSCPAIKLIRGSLSPGGGGAFFLPDGREEDHSGAEVENSVTLYEDSGSGSLMIKTTTSNNSPGVLGAVAAPAAGVMRIVDEEVDPLASVNGEHVPSPSRRCTSLVLSPQKREKYPSSSRTKNTAPAFRLQLPTRMNGLFADSGLPFSWQHFQKSLLEIHAHAQPQMRKSR